MQHNRINISRRVIVDLIFRKRDGEQDCLDTTSCATYFSIYPTKLTSDETVTLVVTEKYQGDLHIRATSHLKQMPASTAASCVPSVVVRKHINSYRTSFIATITINILYIPNKQSTLTRYFTDVSHFHIFVENRLCSVVCSKQTI